jgi:acyl-coenzyme A thioesterase PaaI-like protein
VTIALDIKFISASKEGDVLIGKVKISKKTNSLVFVVAELFEKKNLVATSSGTWKII